MSRSKPRLSDFLGLPAPDAPSRGDLPDPGCAPGPDGSPGRCAQLAPRRGGGPQEPGTIRSAPVPPAFRPGGGAGVEPEGELYGIAQAAEALGLKRATFTDWVTDGLIPAPTHEHPSDRRRGLCWTAAELNIIRDGLLEFRIIRIYRGRLRKTRTAPGGTGVTAWLIQRMNALWAAQAPRNPDLVQGQGAFRAVELPEVPTAMLVDGSEVIRQQPEPIEELGPLRHSVDIRRWAPVSRSRPLPSIVQVNRDRRRVSPHYRRGR